MIIDERRGRRIARQVYGLPVKGTAGILVEAHRRGLISGVSPRLLELRAAGYAIVVMHWTLSHTCLMRQS